MMSEFWENGFDAYYQGDHTSPYAEGTAAHEQWTAGHDAAWSKDQAELDARWDNDYSDYGYAGEYGAVEQGYYDDDPSPYNGDYSEM